jgi:hypothetical protein
VLAATFAAGCSDTTPPTKTTGPISDPAAGDPAQFSGGTDPTAGGAGNPAGGPVTDPTGESGGTPK